VIVLRTVLGGQQHLKSLALLFTEQIYRPTLLVLTVLQIERYSHSCGSICETTPQSLKNCSVVVKNCHYQCIIYCT